MILERTKKECLNSPETKKLKEQLDIFAKEGLRTLLLAKRELDSEWFNRWKREYENAKSDIDKRYFFKFVKL